MAQSLSAASGDMFDPADFGLEIEAPIIVDEKLTGDKVRLAAAAKQILPLFERAGVMYTTDPFLGAAQAKEHPDYTKWHIVADSTTYSPIHLEGVGPLEFNSPVWKANKPEWREQLAKVESLVCSQLAKDKPASFQRCSTHIHLSFPSEQRKEGRLENFPVMKARLIILAARVFEEVLDGLLPMKKDPNRFTKRNTLPRDIESPLDDHSMELGKVWNKMKEVATLHNLQKMVCWEPGYDDRIAGGHDRNFKWNFGGGKAKALQWKTVEYRQLPPVTVEGQLVTWVNFILGFVGAATSIDPQKLDAAANISEKAVYGVYGLQKQPSRFVDIQQFIEQFIEKYPNCEIDKQLLKRTPDIKAQVQRVMK